MNVCGCCEAMIAFGLFAHWGIDVLSSTEKGSK